MVCLLACQGRSLGTPLLFPQLSHLGSEQEGCVLEDGLLHSGMYFVLCFS